MTKPSPTPGSEVSSDIDDTPADLERFPRLRDSLLACGRILSDVYHTADADAQRHQRHHQRLTLIAMICGTTAVLFAILQLANLFEIPALKLMELIAALAAVAAVGTGLFAARRSMWLLHRHRAERCRLLKFQFLTGAATWASTADHAVRLAQLERDAQALAKLDRHGLLSWSENDELPELPGGPQCADVPEEVRHELAAYYQEKRLKRQIEYFTRRLMKDRRSDVPTRHLPAICFFLSVLATLGHFAYDLGASNHGSHDVSVVLITLAAAFPVIGSGIHTLRMAHEFSRNTVRFRAKVVVLIRIAQTLSLETVPESLFRELWVGEQVLESEHREWLRLMLDAEWFG